MKQSVMIIIRRENNCQNHLTPPSLTLGSNHCHGGDMWRFGRIAHAICETVPNFQPLRLPSVNRRAILSI